jgi:signal transduction histidine kinase
MVLDDSFARLVSLACHDLRTPLATVSGFAHTLGRLEDLGPQGERYVEMILAGSEQMAELLDDLGLASRIEAGRFQPLLVEAGTGELAAAAAERLGDRATSAGEGATVEVDRGLTERALAGFALCAVRHGGVDAVELRAEGPEISIAPVTADAAKVVTGEEPKDLGALVANRFFEAVGVTVELDGETLRVRMGQ